MPDVSLESLVNKVEVSVDNLLSDYAEASAEHAILYKRYRVARDALLDPDVWHPLAIETERAKKRLEYLRKEIESVRERKRIARANSLKEMAEYESLGIISKEAIAYLKNKKRAVLSPELSRGLILMAEQQGLSNRQQIMQTRKDLVSQTIHCVVSRDNRPIDLLITDEKLSTTQVLPSMFGVSEAFKPIASVYMALLVNKSGKEIKDLSVKDVAAMQSLLVRKDILKKLKVHMASAYMFAPEGLVVSLKHRLHSLPKGKNHLPPFIEGDDRKAIEHYNRLIGEIKRG